MRKGVKVLAKDQFGFSLQELVTGLLIYSLIIVSVGFFVRAPQARLADQAGDIIKNTLQNSIVVGFGANRDLIVRIKEQEISVEGSGKGLRTRLPDGVRVYSKSKDGITIYVRRHGSVSPRTIIVADRKRSCAITISLRGRVTKECTDRQEMI